MTGFDTFPVNVNVECSPNVTENVYASDDDADVYNDTLFTSVPLEFVLEHENSVVYGKTATEGVNLNDMSNVNTPPNVLGATELDDSEA